MANARLENMVAPTDATLKQVMNLMSANTIGVVFICDSDGILRGVITDGDIRRAFLTGATVEQPCQPYLRPSYTAGRVGVPRNENLALMSRRILHLPLVDADGRLVDYLSWKDMWHVPLVSPSLSGNELRYVEECISTGWISSQGPFIQRFEAMARDFLGTGFALSTANGTLSLQLAIQALDIGPGDEVIVPNFTFGASANAVMQRGATPVFADIDPASWTLSPESVAALVGPRTKAIMPVHIYGQACDMDPIMDIARSHGLKVIEDCAEALGAEYKGRRVGSIGDVGCFSFFANKIITTGEGGLVTVNDPQLYERLKMLRDHGVKPERRYWHLEPGTNCRMTNLQAALGVAQMERVDEFLALRDRLAERYDAELAGIRGIVPHRAANWGRKVCWLYSVVVEPESFGMDRDSLLAALRELGVEARPVFPALDDQPAFVGSRAGDVEASRSLAVNGLSLPTGNEMSVIEVVRVVEALRILGRTE
ncbi:DegT/DnrJ/EryC1/StrS family aminotransferase [Magnetospirillum aberrantis]|uniref:GDP-perosamine synthase n=1 Tax=Magnetospirillum aberrantis SpK TaxID=908842 RepID=A0A7C9URF0_9PROT|nr:DegT/DnrJ/EryC1/StrS family aminotransferase [Magnetospirillum aberrantis]NFV78548.1 CBS domain-containing protein [Magnetospirillum aberrantis SpK]